MASASSARHVLLTGPPGIGKTTLVKKVSKSLQEKGLSLHGFYTEELRQGGARVGFDVVTLDGHRGALARVSEGSEPVRRREYRVGKYRVELQSFENLALTVLRPRNAGPSPVFIIDEIGKMELFSSSFQRVVQALLDNPNVRVFATIPVPKGKPIPFVEAVRKRADAMVFEVSRENRDVIQEDLLKKLTS